jgi:GT2 family glycosyltransferase
MKQEDRKVSIIIPVIRKENVKKLVDTIYANAGIPKENISVYAEADEERIGCPKMIKTMTDKVIEMHNHPYICFLGDDTLPEKNFLKIAFESMEMFDANWGLVGLNDNYDEVDGNLNATHWIAHRRLLPFLDDEFFHTGYVHSFCDNELTDRCKEIGRYIFAPDAKVKHINPIVDKTVPWDDDYKWAYSPANSARDNALYIQRKNNRNRISEDFKLGIAFPITDEKVHTSFFISYITMEKPEEYTLLIPKWPGQIDAIRDNLVEQALIEGVTHMIMMDTDQIYPVDTIIKLLKNRDKDVVAVPVHRRYPPYDPIVLKHNPKSDRYWHIPDKEVYSGELIEADAIGTGCMMFDTRCFMDTPRPWFKIDGKRDGTHIGEDVFFCRNMKKAGKRIWVDTSIEIGHIAQMEVARPLYELYKRYRKFGWVKPPDLNKRENLEPASLGIVEEAEVGQDNVEVVNDS